MYNSELKARFISEFSENDARRHAAKITFDATEPFEEKWGADICTRGDENELKAVVTEIVGVRGKSQKTRLTILRDYARWCMENQVEGACDAIFKVKDFGLEKLRRQTVANPRHLQRYLDCILEKESEETPDNTYRCLCWMAYAGIENERDALSISDDDVDFDNMVFRFKGEEFPIYREAIPAFRNCARLKEFRYKRPQHKKDTFKERAPGHMLLRGEGEPKSYLVVRAGLSRRAGRMRYMSEADKKDETLLLQMSFYRIWLSGLFFRAYEEERAGIPADFTDAAKRFMKGKTYKLDSGRNLIGAKQRQVAKDFLNDYKRWKEAYSI